MRALIQRVSKASVSIDGETVGKIGKGIVILLGVTHDDSEKDADYLAEKCVNLRIFEDENGKMNLSTIDVGGSALIVSQFTLYGDTRKGRRPSYTDAALPEKAIPLYEYFIEKVKAVGLEVATGRFGASMNVDIHNQGPVTLMVESK
jgi:D-tyrosyl-tRNA(Tyr) deacylase